MIFFALKKTDFNLKSIFNGDSEKDPGFYTRGLTLLPWFDVFKDFNELSTEAHQCVKDLQITINAEFFQKALIAYAYPLSGNVFSTNITKDPQKKLEGWWNFMEGRDQNEKPLMMREGGETVKVNWFVDATERPIEKDKFISKAEAIIKNMNRLIKNKPLAKDRSLIYGSLKELVRHLAAISTSKWNERLSKLMALELCVDPSLLKAQKEMIGQKLGENPNNRKPEYLNYYCGDNFASMLEKATNFVHSTLPSAQENIRENMPSQGNWKWELFPPVIQGAILINDFRKVFATENPHERNLITLNSNEETLVIGSKNYAISNHIPSRVYERRYSLDLQVQPLHQGLIDHSLSTSKLGLRTGAGPSGHMAGILNYWKENPNHKLIVACSLFALWNLYYDKRLTPIHTLVEVFQSILTPGVYPGGSSTLNMRNHIFETLSLDHVRNGNFTLSPTDLLLGLTQRYHLREDIKQDRESAYKLKVQNFRSNILKQGYLIVRSDKDLVKSMNNESIEFDWLFNS